MTVPAARAVHIFRQLLEFRRGIALLFIALGVLGAFGATRVRDDSAIDSLMVADDPDAQASRRFEQIFPEGQHALLMLETRDPLGAAALAGAAALERRLAAIPGVEPHGLLTIYYDGTPPSAIDDAAAQRIRRFATGTGLLRRAGLLGDGFLGVAVELHMPASARDRTLAAIDAACDAFTAPAGPFTAVRRVGQPWLDAWLEHETTAATVRSMPLFGLFLVTLVCLLYRSWRVLLAFCLTLAVVVADAVGLAAVAGWPHTVVSSLVPLTVLVTTTATLVYIHSRYIERGAAAGMGDGGTGHSDASGMGDGGGTGDLLDHHARVLANKFLPCTASIFATAVGFAALEVSNIRPVRQMGLWTASGLVVSWFACFSLFPALQSLLKTPTRTAASGSGRYAAFVDWWLPWTRRLRWPLLAVAFAGMGAGAVALFGLPGHVQPLALQTDTLSYIDPALPAARDTRRFEQINGLGVFELWVTTPPGAALDPAVLAALDELQRALEADPRITAVDGPTSVLRWARYVQSGVDELPRDPAAWDQLAGSLEQILLTQPGARGYVDLGTLSNLRLEIRGRDHAFGRLGAMRRYIEDTWRRVQQRESALKGVTARVVGQSVLSDQISLQLVPTLTESFAITASVIFCAFLVVFRSPSARLMAMIPSLFAILAAFLVMRGAGIGLNIATILIGSTVLGATENDQVHFFYHYQEGGPATAGRLRHAFLVAGRPILFATLINASGFLALAFSRLPPMHQFGVVSSSAFTLALVADFTALPAALWLMRGPRPGAPPGAAAAG